jgi:NhaP-type Na+/H+ or K+/H+ antiporter
MGVVALPLLCLLASEGAGASMFIAAFVAGLTVQAGFKDAGRHGVELSEEWGQVVNLFVFFFFGVLAAKGWGYFGVRHVVYAVLSLTVIRMIPVAVSLLGTGLCGASVAFIGWFGPRGLASIVLGLVYIEEVKPMQDEVTIRLAVMVTVLLSVVVHGVSAMPGIGWYSARVARLGADAPENKAIGQARA